MTLSTSEIVIDKSGNVRQAGSSEAGEFVRTLKTRAEGSLFFFAKAIMGYDLMSPTLHLPVCNQLQELPPYRKLFLMPRGHLKTTILKALAIHMLIQPAGRNVYFPGVIGGCTHNKGTSTRLLFASKTAQLAMDTLGEIVSTLETNQLLRALWSDCVWEDVKQAKVWNREHIVLPRKDIFKEASIETVGVGGQITGYHFNCHIFDDLIDINDANSPTTMQTAIDWFKASRALMDHQDTSLEYTVGTRWAVKDLYEYIEKEDPSVEVICRRVIEDGVPIFPERFSMEAIARLQREMPTLFPLLYMNSATDPSLIDFDMSLMRYFIVEDGHAVFEEDPRDVVALERRDLAEDLAATKRSAMPMKPGTRLDRDGWNQLAARNEYVKTRRVRST